MAATMNLHLDIDVMVKVCIITEWTIVLRDMMLCSSVRHTNVLDKHDDFSSLGLNLTSLMQIG
jgi:hypothetical protein